MTSLLESSIAQLHNSQQKRDFYLKVRYCQMILLFDLVRFCMTHMSLQKLGSILENKLFEKLKLPKNIT
jgi:hypothetical protein